MTTSKKAPPRGTPETPPPGTQAAPHAAPAVQSDITELTAQLRELIKKLDAPKRKDAWDILAVLSTFMASVLIAGISVYVTYSLKKMESDRTTQFNNAQLATQHAQIRIEELKAITSFAPLLSANDPETKRVANNVLKAVQKASAQDRTGRRPEPAPRPPTEAPQVATDAPQVPTSLIDSFATIALSPEAPAGRRVEAVRRIAQIGTAPSATPAVRERAKKAATRIATSRRTPIEVQRAATQAVHTIEAATATVRVRG